MGKREKDRLARLRARARRGAIPHPEATPSLARLAEILAAREVEWEQEGKPEIPYDRDIEELISILTAAQAEEERKQGRLDRLVAGQSDESYVERLMAANDEADEELARLQAEHARLLTDSLSSES